MMKKALKALVWTVVLALSAPVFSQASNADSEESFKVDEMIMHHIKDGHEWNVLTVNGKDGTKKDITIPLPVILIDNGMQIFSSNELYKNSEVVAVNVGDDADDKIYLANTEKGYGVYEEKIYTLNSAGELEFDENGSVTNVRPLDFSITKNALTVLFAGLLVFFLMRMAAKTYSKTEIHAPKGFARFVEPLIVFVRDDIALENIGEAKYKKYLPYLLTIFFFIWINNLLGMIPIFPGGANLVGNIAFTGVLASLTLLITVFSGNKSYWKHIFATPGVPIPLLIIMVPIEIIGVFTKPFALMVRLFANMVAGHIIGLSLVGIIFIFANAAWAGLSVPLSIFMRVLEMLVCLLQAYIFTILSALFIGEAVAEGH